jgi:hypothetical protein
LTSVVKTVVSRNVVSRNVVTSLVLTSVVETALVETALAVASPTGDLWSDIQYLFCSKRSQRRKTNLCV